MILASKCMKYEECPIYHHKKMSKKCCGREHEKEKAATGNFTVQLHTEQGKSIEFHPWVIFDIDEYTGDHWLSYGVENPDVPFDPDDLRSDSRRIFIDTNHTVAILTYKNQNCPLR